MAKTDWNKGYDPQTILKRLNAIKHHDSAGKITYEGFEHKIISALLLGAVKFPVKLPDNNARQIINQTTMALDPNEDITPQKFLAEIDQQVTNYLQLPVSDFILATSVSIQRLDKALSFRTKNAEIQIGKSWKDQIRDDWKKTQSSASHVTFAAPPSDYQEIRVKVTAKSQYEAAEKALDSLDLVRGVLNWFYNSSTPFRMSFGSRDPINTIVLGPVHTLHDTGGMMVPEIFWYESHYRAPIKSMDMKRHLSKQQVFYKQIQKGLNTSQYQSDLEDALIRYARALDERDWDNAFRQLWGLLEKLTASMNDNYDATIKRAAFIYADRDYQKQVLHQLRNYRNRLVHAGVSSGENETYLYQLKNVVEDLLLFHISHGRKFRSFADAAEFLDLPTTEVDLKLRKKRAEIALKYRGYKQ